MFASAYFCLPKNALQDAISKDQSSSSVPADVLKRQLLVVKVFRDAGGSSPLSEVAILEQIKKQGKHRSSTLPMIQILASASTNTDTAWIAMSTLPFSCNLAALASRFNELPQEFPWLVYIQTQQALIFLRKSGDPPIAHGDLHVGNVLVGYETLEGTCLPQVKLIDLGSAEHNMSLRSGVSKFDVEAWQLLQILQKLLRRAGSKCESCSFNGYLLSQSRDRKCPSKICCFHQKIAEELAPNRKCGGSLLDKLWERFGSYAERKVEACPPTSQARIREVILEVTQALRTVMDIRIQEILAQAEKAANSTCWMQ
jgi:hypothetical protein